MKFKLVSAGVIAAVFGMNGSADSQLRFTGPPAAVQLRIEVDNGKEALASAVLVHRDDGARGVVLYFLTSESVLHPASAAAPIAESNAEGSNRETVTPGIAVLRILIENSTLAPAAVTLEPVQAGAPFFIVCYTAAGKRIVVPQRVQRVSERSVTGDLELDWAAGCVGAPAFNTRGVFGVVTECNIGQPPAITLASAATGLLRRLIPGMDLGQERSRTFGIGH
jgi:hypothetical protein